MEATICKDKTGKITGIYSSVAHMRFACGVLLEVEMPASVSYMQILSAILGAGFSYDNIKAVMDIFDLELWKASVTDYWIGNEADLRKQAGLES